MQQGILSEQKFPLRGTLTGGGVKIVFLNIYISMNMHLDRKISSIVFFDDYLVAWSKATCSYCPLITPLKMGALSHKNYLQHTTWTNLFHSIHLKVHDIWWQNFLLGIIATAGITLRAIEYIWVLLTVLADSFSVAGILWWGSTCT